MTEQIFNSAPININNWRIDEDTGMMTVTARILKEGIFDYAADAIDMEHYPEFTGLVTIRELIPASAYTPKALESLEGKPVLAGDHEWKTAQNTLNADNEQAFTVGSIAGEARITDDGKMIEVDMLIMDEETIDKIKSGELIEVSAGYNGDLLVESGEHLGKHKSTHTYIH